MSLSAGIIGLPNVGKSTLFNAITNNQILVANYPFATIQPNIGMVTVPDQRLNTLVSIYQPAKIIPATYEFIDIAGLVKGAATGQGLGNQFLSHIREVDAICQVVRCFDDETIIHVDAKTDPLQDMEVIDLELILADLEMIEKRLLKVEKVALTTRDKKMLFEYNLLQKVFAGLKQNIPARNLNYNDSEYLLLKSFNLLTIKPIIYLANIGENDIGKSNKYIEQVQTYAKRNGTKAIAICAKVEAELSVLSESDKELFLKELGIVESGLDQLIKATYSLLGLATFFTCGDKEVKAWTFKEGMLAPTCAGLIHSDFERGFIKAEVISYEDLIANGGEKEAREHGKMRLEGKNYQVRDGDICHFRFNV